MQSKITAIEPRGSWEGKYGKMYSFKVLFEDGQSLEVNAKSDTPPYKVGDLMQYQVLSDDPKFGAKGKVSKPETTTSERTGRDKDIMRQTALKAAVEFNAQRQVETSRVIIEAEMFYKWLIGEHDILEQ